jgi:hypothetical protein
LQDKEQQGLFSPYLLHGVMMTIVIFELLIFRGVGALMGFVTAFRFNIRFR